jgi:IS6 family transposase
LAYEHVAELLAERGLEVDASCVWRWVQVYSPELNRRCQPHLKRTNKSYRVDETYIKVKAQDKYLYRAVDSTGQTIDFLLTAKRDTAGAKRFFEKVFSSSSNPIPRVINVGLHTAGIRQRARLIRIRTYQQRDIILLPGSERFVGRNG